MNQSEQESLGSIQTRVHHLEQGLTNLSRTMQEGFSKITEQFQTQAARFDQDRKPQWQAYGVMLTGMVILGTLAYWPIREQQGRLEQLIVKMDDQKVDTVTFNLASERGKESRIQINEDIRRGDTELQRQIDEIKRSQGDTYSLRDAFMESKQEIKELKEAVFKSRAP